MSGIIPVTKCFLPPLEDYLNWVKVAYKNEWLTNRGELVRELEDRVKSHLLSSTRPIIMNNGTVPLQIALKLLGKGGEIITTPFSYVATTSAIVWEGCTPVFVDIDPEYLTIDETEIENAITQNTTCILATHVFGNPCNIEAIDTIARKYNLSVIYDAAHCFEVKYNDSSIFNFGDVSTCSFHATKLFHTGEGGAAFCKDEGLYSKIYYSHNFGHDGPLSFEGLGINGKISELQAAMGLAVLPYMTEILNGRAHAVNYYDTNIHFSNVTRIKIRENTQWNFSYYPITFDNEKLMQKLIIKLAGEGIYPRRYFYPSLDTLPYVSSSFNPVSREISSRILCLPLYHNIEQSTLEKIVKIVNSM